MPNPTLEQLLTELTPDRLKALIYGLAAGQPAGARSDVPLTSLLDALAEGLDLGTGAVGWSAQLRLKRAIMAGVGQIAGLRYIEGDA